MEEKNYTYIMVDNKIIKLDITVDEKTIKELFDILYKNSATYQTTGFYLANEKKTKSLNFPTELINKGNRYVVPSELEMENDILFILTDIYNSTEEENKIVTASDIQNLADEQFSYTFLCKETVCEPRDLIDMKRNLVTELVNNFDIKVEDVYSVDSLYNKVQSKQGYKTLKKLIKQANKTTGDFMQLGIKVKGNRIKLKNKTM